MRPRVLVTIVTYNSSLFLRACLDSLKSQTCPDLHIALWDNASTDETINIAASGGDVLDEAHFSATNIGFCAGHNRLIAAKDSDYVLVLNPDVLLEPTFIEILVAALDRDASAGAATGKLWRWDDGARAELPQRQPDRKTLDTTGIYFTKNQRHLDRGSGELDSGQFENLEYVFGASGAAAFYRRGMLDDIRSGDEYFDESFFAYREDADLAWRAQWMGWNCLYIPAARGYHVRRVLPERRSDLPAVINMHSFKNRFLLRVKNMDAGCYARFFIPITLRDLAALAYVLIKERYSLRGIPLLLRALPKTWRMRKALRRHRRISPAQMRTWFSNQPASKPVQKA